MRKPLIAGNWKMHKNSTKAVETAIRLVDLIPAGTTQHDIMIAPPFTALSQVYEIIKSTCVSLGAQNLYWEKKGAFTGEISSEMLASTGCKYVIIGHSERRQYFGETDETVNKKINAAICADLIPILCVGESAQERESEKTFSVLDKQIKNGLDNCSGDFLKTLVLAYEPVWAIGTGKTATTEQAQEVHQFLRSLIEKIFGNQLAKSIRILYGGSVKPDNIKNIMVMPDIDGVLVGGASLDSDTFYNIINFNA